jgi:hypothetical protein
MEFGIVNIKLWDPMVWDLGIRKVRILSVEN